MKSFHFLSVRFGQNLLAETNGFKLIIDKKEDLSGLPEGVNSTGSGNGKIAEYGREMGIYSSGSEHDTLPSVFRSP